MDLFNTKRIQALEKKLQATEGAASNVILESLLISFTFMTALKQYIRNLFCQL